MILKNTWIGGLDRDTAKEKNQNKTMYDCLNFRVLTDSGLSTAALENIKGNLLSIDIPLTTVTYIDNGISTTVANAPLNIIGVGQVGSKTVLLTTSNQKDVSYYVADPTDDFQRDGQIWELTYVNTTTIPTPTLTLRYNGMLNFSTAHPIYKIVGNPENSESDKIYWTDAYNKLRFCNLMDYNSGTGLLNIPDITFFELKSNIDFTVPVLAGVNGGGSHKAGVMRYGYQLYNKYGSESVMSPLSNVIHITDANEAGNTRAYKGADVGVDVNKSMLIKIDGLDSNYDRIKVYSFFYDTLNGSPLINIIEDTQIPSTGTIYVSDTGEDSLGVFTEEEMLALIQSDFICKSIDDNRNYLFAAGIKDKYFDIPSDVFEPRAIRFRRNDVYPGFVNEVPLYPTYPAQVLTDFSCESLDLITYPGGVSQYLSTFKETVDERNINYFNQGISRYNIHTSTSIAYSAFEHQYETLRLGGTGANINYTFKLKPFSIDKILVGTPFEATQTYTATVTSDANPALSGVNRFYQRDEVYRFGIIFKNTKGMSSFVKWIGDIRMPHASDQDSAVPTYTDITGNKFDFSLSCIAPDNTVRGLGLHLNMDVTIPQELIDLGVTQFDIVRVKRDSNDRHILLNGMLSPMISITPGEVRQNEIVDYNSFIRTNSPNYFNLISPEAQYNQNTQYTSGDYIDVIGMSESANYRWYTYLTNGHCQKLRGHVMVPIANTYYYGVGGTYGYKPVIDGAMVGNTELYLLNGTYISNRSRIDPSNDTHGCTSYILQMDNVNTPLINPASNTYDHYFTYVNYKRPLAVYTFGAGGAYWLGDHGVSIQYGGETYSDRQRNTYISCGVNKTVTTAGVYNVDVLGGDTFIAMYDTQKIYNEPNSGTGFNSFNTVILPVETSINLYLTHGDTINRERNFWYHQELKGVYTLLAGGVFTQASDMYLYNSVYSKERETQLFIPKPTDFLLEDDKPHMVKYSEKKIDGEIVDSWTSFKANNFNFAEGKYGAITDIINHNGKLVNIQPSGVGIWAVLDRSLISDNSGAQLALGTGTVLERLDYPFTNAGSIHQSSILSTNKGLYFFDYLNKEWKSMVFGQGMNELSELKHMSSYLRNNLNPLLATQDNPINDRGFAVGWNKKFNEVYLTAIQNIDAGDTAYEDYTLCYSETLNTFTSFYSFRPYMYALAEEKLLSIVNPLSRQVYIHDLGTRGQFYGVTYNSMVKFMTTFQGQSGAYTNQSFLSEVIDNTGSNLVDETFNTIRSTNDYQDSGYITLTLLDDNAVGTLKRRMRVWHTEVWRDSGSVDDARIRDAYLMSEYTYTNNLDKRFVVHDFDTLFYPANN